MKKIFSILLAVLMVASVIPMTVFAENATSYKVGDHIQFGNYPQSRETDEKIIAQLDAMEKEWKDYGFTISEDVLQKVFNEEYLENENYFYSYGISSLKSFVDYADIDFDGDGRRDYRAVTLERFFNSVMSQNIEKEDLERFFGQYADGFSEGKIYYFRFEPVTWRILDPDNGLIMAESLLDSMAYNECVVYAFEKTLINVDSDNLLYFANEEMKAKANDYAESTIRKWLNNEFLNEAFTEEQKALIKDDVALDNNSVAKFYASHTNEDGNVSLLDDVYENNTNQYPETYDKIFLLSSMDVVNPDYGFKRDEYGYSADKHYSFDKINESRNASCTDYSLSQGLCYSNWWLRTPSYNMTPDNIMSDLYANYVTESLYMPFCYMGGFAHPTYEEFGVRPACRLKVLGDNTEKAYVDGYYPTSGQCGDNAYWEYDENTKTLTVSGTGEMWDVTESKYGFPVPYGNVYANYAEKIVIGDGITKIGRSSFFGYVCVNEITLPDSLKEISTYAFAWNYNLKKINFGEGLEVIGYGAFNECAVISEIILPSSVKRIESSAFSGCFNLKKLKLNEGLEYLAEDALVNLFSLEELEIPSTVNKIGVWTDIIFFSSIKNIINNSSTAMIFDEDIFEDEEEIEFPTEKAREIITYTFSTLYSFIAQAYLSPEKPYDDEVDKEVRQKTIEAVNKKFGTNYESIDDLQNEDFETVKDFPDYITISCLSDSAQHEQCKVLGIKHTIIDGPDYDCIETSGQCGDNAYWEYDEETKTLYITGEGPMWDGPRIDPEHYTGHNGDYYRYYFEHLVIGDGITKIGTASFYDNSIAVKDIHFGSGVEEIGSVAFVGTSLLEKLVIPGNVKKIGSSAFGRAYGLRSIVIEEGVETIEEGAFSNGCAVGSSPVIEEIVIPSTVTNLAPNAIIIPKEDTYIVNHSSSAVVSFCSMDDNIVFYSREFAEFYSDTNIKGTYFYIYGIEYINEKYGVSLSNEDEFFEWLDADNNNNSFDENNAFIICSDNTFPDNIQIESLSDSAQHEQCKELGIKHSLIDSTCDDACGIHDIYSNEYIAPTCTENGYRGGKVCLECEKVFEEPEIIAPTGHTVVTAAEIPATCTVGGVTAYSYCSVCEEYITQPENIMPTGHVDHNEDGLCDNCGEQITDEEITFTFFERVRNFFATIIDRIIAIFRRLFK